ncbi:interferon-induced GTP-binding protein Mx2 [Xylaria nigripes]|nr:interferon-induced GTP-binding protein Mx2 [Xylaria nigripes]
MKIEAMEDAFENYQKSPGNLSILTKVDKLRELVGTGVALPQLVVVGDQSSGKSSVLENLTGFAFPRDAELCTRYATQITCRREITESISVTIIASPDSTSDERGRLKKFHHSVSELSSENLAEIFKDANKAMGISTPSNRFSSDGTPLPAFSEHMLKIEKLGPKEEHFTVIDVPGIFRRETEGLTTESDITLVRNMVMKYMRDSRTIILAIIPSNVDPATQEILKLAKQVDLNMSRTMAVLTKPDLAIEQTTQRIAIDHVIGTRGDLTLGYYIVKNRGPDPVDANKTLEEGQQDERVFFSRAPWSELAATGKAGIGCLKRRVRELLTDLIKKEFPKLKSEVTKKLHSIRERHDDLGTPRNDQHAQRAYLNGMSEAFQSIARDALNAYYVGNKIFSYCHDLRLITRIVEASEWYVDEMMTNGHTREFKKCDEEGSEAQVFDNKIRSVAAGGQAFQFGTAVEKYPELEAILHSWDRSSDDTIADDIDEYIEAVYKSSRGQEIGNIGNGLLATLFKEQSKNWEDITLEYLSAAIYHVHHFTSEIVKKICPDPYVHDELWNGYLLEELMKSYSRAMHHARYLLSIEREESPLTLNNSFSKQWQKLMTERLINEMKTMDIENSSLYSLHQEHEAFMIRPSQLDSLTADKTNEVQVREQMHDYLLSYYVIARDRFVDVVYQQAVNHFLLFGEKSPLKIFSTAMVLGLNEDQLDMIAAEDALVKQNRERLVREITNYEDALKVLKGTR